jgi:hypothetical protein
VFSGVLSPLLLLPHNVLGSAGLVPHCILPVSDEDDGDSVGVGAPWLFLHKFAADVNLLFRFGRPALAGHVCLLLVAELALLLGLDWTASCLSSSSSLGSGKRFQDFL